MWDQRYAYKNWLVMNIIKLLQVVIMPVQGAGGGGGGRGGNPQPFCNFSEVINLLINHTINFII